MGQQPRATSKSRALPRVTQTEMRKRPWSLTPSEPCCTGQRGPPRPTRPTPVTSKQQADVLMGIHDGARVGLQSSQQAG